MVTGKTSTGFEFAVDTDKLMDDFELLDLMSQLQTETDPARQSLLLIPIMKKMIGTKSFAQLRKHCTENGIISSQKMYSEMNEIYSYSGNNSSELKN